MGMYDHLIFKTDNWGTEKGKQYQTRSLECLLDNFYVEEDGKLLWVQDHKIFKLPAENYTYTGEIRFCDYKIDYVAWCVDGYIREVIKLTI